MLPQFNEALSGKFKAPNQVCYSMTCGKHSTYYLRIGFEEEGLALKKRQTVNQRQHQPSTCICGPSVDENVIVILKQCILKLHLDIGQWGVGSKCVFGNNCYCCSCKQENYLVQLYKTCRELDRTGLSGQEKKKN